MRPFPQTRALTDSQRDFDKSLSSAKVVVEQAFGLLKRRWRYLLNKLDESVEKVSSTVISCFILHNICLEVNDPTEIDVVSNGNGFPRVSLPGHDINADGATLRNIIKDICSEALFYDIFTAKISSFSFQFSYFKQKKVVILVLLISLVTCM